VTGWRADGPVILMPLVRDVLLMPRLAAIIPKRPQMVMVRGVLKLLH